MEKKSLFLVGVLSFLLVYYITWPYANFIPRDQFFMYIYLFYVYGYVVWLVPHFILIYHFVCFPLNGLYLYSMHDVLTLLIVSSWSCMFIDWVHVPIIKKDFDLTYVNVTDIKSFKHSLDRIITLVYRWGLPVTSPSLYHIAYWYMSAEGRL